MQKRYQPTNSLFTLLRSSVRLQIFCVALVLSTTVILVHPLGEDAAAEVSYVAASLARGEGFGSPFGGSTGPTAFVPPVYPFILAGIFKLAGVQSQRSVILAQLFDTLCSSLTAVLIYSLGRRIVAEQVARISAYLWSFVVPISYLLRFGPLLPCSGYWSFDVWVTALTALVVLVLLLVTCKSVAWEGYTKWAGFGILFGVSGLTNPSVLAIFPACAYWSVRSRREKFRRWFLPWLALTAAMVVSISPWLVRNYLRFHAPVFIRSNFWLEIQMVNNEQNTGVWTATMHPDANPSEFRRYAAEGELAYIRNRRRLALEFIRQQPARFVLLTARRIKYVWLSEPTDSRLLGRWGDLKRLPFAGFSLLALVGFAFLVRNRSPYSALIGGTLLLYPMVYYFANSSPMYRFPLDPLLMLLAVSGAREVVRMVKRDRNMGEIPPTLVRPERRSVRQGRTAFIDVADITEG